tara:strand:- start:9675 stop:10484 length:810 start_codon:yes stop_codon:yes gene_type:complete
MKKQWELLNISYQELEKYKFPEYQRLKINKNKTSAIEKILINAKEYNLLPIVVSEDFLIVDGGHRSVAFRECYKRGDVVGGIWVLIDKKASKETFIQLNMGSPVSIAHKIYISDNIEKMRKNGFSFTQGNSTKSSFGVSDFARAFYIYSLKESFRQASASKLIDFINDMPYSDCVNAYIKLTILKNRYVDNLIVGQRFLQKHFLYFTWFEKLNLITEKDYEKIVPRLPKSLGGDIGMVYNKNLFLECFNYGRKKTRQDLSVFNREEESN